MYIHRLEWKTSISTRWNGLSGQQLLLWKRRPILPNFLRPRTGRVLSRGSPEKRRLGAVLKSTVIIVHQSAAKEPPRRPPEIGIKHRLGWQSFRAGHVTRYGGST